MSGRSLRVICRIIFVICGVVSLVTAVPYAMLRGVSLPYQSEWVVFVVALGVISIFSVAVTLVRRRWIAKLLEKSPADERLFLWPLKMLGVFALVFYSVAVFAYFAPHTWSVNDQIMLALCPLYLIRMTFDPPPALVFFVLAPMNAAVYGALGLMLAYFWLVVRTRHTEPTSGDSNH